MTHVELVEKGLHNRHIRFVIDGKILTGVVVDDQFHKNGKTKATHYTFIPSYNVTKWKDAESQNNKELMYSLSQVVDIEDITWGEQYLETRNHPFREVELVNYIAELTRKNDNFRNLLVEAPLENTRYRADLILERKKGTTWEKMLIEIKVITTLTESRLKEVIEQLKTYQKFAKGISLLSYFQAYFRIVIILYFKVKELKYGILIT
ncbi:hypothetical protein [Fluviicola sp.]|uniref:hypothetical protein n=1 Tax=Fluviicola sp. TaxID=1917219 RepID=UPI003D29A692